MAELRIDVWSDIACPWCWVGKRHLETALASFDGEVEVHWRAFELDPSAPREAPASVDYVGRLAKKYRTDRAQAQAMIDRMVEVGRQRDLEFRFDRVRPTNTFDAHRLLALAAERGVQTALKEALFVAYMNEGRAVADHAVLAALAADVGLDADETASVLSTDAYAEAVRGDEQMAAQLGITGVPFFAFDGRFGVPGAQPPDVLARALTSASNLIAEDAAVCGPDGCEV